MTIAVNRVHSLNYAGTNLHVFHANKGEGIPKHSHEYSHATMCHAGSCKVSLEGREHIIDKDSMPLNLLGGEYHEIEALEDDTVFVNVFAEGRY